MSTNSEQGREDVEFLKDQVQRLNALLSQYQRKGLSVTQDDADSVPLSANGQQASWLTNKKLLTPIMLEYDQTINELNKQISTYQLELENLSRRVQEIVEENSKLHSELRKSLEAQLQASSTSGGGGGVSTVVIDGLRQQLDLLSKERDSYIELWRQTTSELESLQKSEQRKTKELLVCRTDLVSAQQAATTAEQTLDEMHSVCRQLDQERARYLKTAKEQEAEASLLQDSLSQARTELKAAGIKNGELKRTLDEITLQLKRMEAERQQREGVEQTRGDKVHLMQLNNADLEGKLLVAQRELVRLKEEKSELEESLSTLQTKTSSLEQREFEAMTHVKESLEIAETALLEKDQAQIREQQLNHEIERLKQTLDTIVKEAGERTSKEVLAVRQECNKSIEKMAVEVQKLEEECGERQAMLERVQREKKAAEKELEKALSQKPIEVTRTGDSLHELQKRACIAERARDDTQVKLDSANVSLKRADLKLKEEKKASEQLEEEYRKRQKKFIDEIEQLKVDKMKLLSEFDEIEQKLRHSEQSKEAAEIRLVQELATLAQRHTMKEKEMTARLESSDEAHQKSTQQLRDMISAQHRVSTRWKEESRTLSQKFERTLSEVKGEMLRYKRRSEELQIQMNHMKATKEDLNKQLSQMTNTNSVLRRQLDDVETKAETAVSQVNTLLAKEKQLLRERRELHNQLDRMKLQMGRNAVGVNLVTGGMGLADLDVSTALPPKLSSLRPLPASPVPPSTHHTSHGFASPSLFKPSLHVPPQVDASNWNATVSNLQHSIRQMKDDLASIQKSQLNQKPSGRKTSLKDSDDDLDISEQSLLSRGDLSPRPTHSTLVHS